MTQAEQASLDRLSDKVDAGFREMRDLMESRRVEEVRVQEQLTTRLHLVESTAAAHQAATSAIRASNKDRFTKREKMFGMAFILVNVVLNIAALYVATH